MVALGEWWLGRRLCVGSNFARIVAILASDERRSRDLEILSPRSNPKGVLEKGRNNGIDCIDNICDHESEFACRQRLLSLRIEAILIAKQNSFWDETKIGGLKYVFLFEDHAIDIYYI